MGSFHRVSEAFMIVTTLLLGTAIIFWSVLNYSLHKMKNLAGLQLIAALYIMADLLKIVNQVIIFCEESFDTLSGVFYVGYLAFQGLAIWIFCFNYFALSWKIWGLKNKNHEDLEMRLAFLFYFLCGYNVIAPIIAGSCPFGKWPSILFYLQTYSCWAVSVLFLANAMKRIHDTL